MFLPKRNKNYQFGPQIRKKGKEQNLEIYIIKEKLPEDFFYPQHKVSFHKELNQVTLLGNSLCLGPGHKNIIEID